MSTANATEALAFYAKDALFVVDDFVPCWLSALIARARMLMLIA